MGKLIQLTDVEKLFAEMSLEDFCSVRPDIARLVADCLEGNARLLRMQGEIGDLRRRLDATQEKLGKRNTEVEELEQKHADLLARVEKIVGGKE